MIHSHINFYSNSSSNGFAKPITLGGSELTPGLIDIKGDGIEEGEGSGDKRDRSSVEKHVEIVEYLKRIPKGIRVRSIVVFVSFLSNSSGNFHRLSARYFIIKHNILMYYVLIRAKN